MKLKVTKYSPESFSSQEYYIDTEEKDALKLCKDHGLPFKDESFSKLPSSIYASYDIKKITDEEYDKQKEKWNSGKINLGSGITLRAFSNIIVI